jgi:hypothetical protein
MKTITKSVLYLAYACAVVAQAPTGTIAGVARDPSGASIAGAKVKLTSRAQGFDRTAVTSEEGDYSFPALLAGEYEVNVEASGFQRMVRQATVEAGTTTTTDFAMRVGEVTESVTVNEASPEMHYDSHAVGGLVTHGQIEDLPLNGRSFLELAKLGPGVQRPTRTNANRTLVAVLSAPGVNVGGTRFTVDGGSITSIGVGGSQMNLSQEAVQEFQVSTVNFDLSTGIAAAGGINVVTRSGGNDLHGTAFYFFRDHKLAAYPALDRDPANPDPFFQRRQFGFALAGPILRDRIFFSGNWERNEQRGVLDTQIWPGRISVTSAALHQARCSAIRSASGWTDESVTRIRHSSATCMMAAGLSGRSFLPRLRSGRRMGIPRPGLASWLGPTRACWVSPACCAPRW